jgi:uncharacterized protein DUF6812
MAESRTVKVAVRTVAARYVGELHIPAMRTRVSDVFNDEQRQFLSLSNVVIDDREEVEFVSVNKRWVESIQEL